MQIDFHYYATYAIARTAGCTQAAAKTIATAAQFVDDNAHDSNLMFDDGSSLAVEATAHHVLDVANIDPQDQRTVWVPFHFLPGNQGESFTERLICRQNSPIAQEMVEHHLRHTDKPYYLELLGIMAHVYGDTFSHYGFSGVSSRRNRVVNDSFQFRGINGTIRDYIENKKVSFFRRFGNALLRNIKSHLAEDLSGALGHGAVVTFPDRPYLEWRFDYEPYGDSRELVDSGWRDNPTTFLAYCEALHGVLARQIASQTKYYDATAVRPWHEIQVIVEDIIANQSDKQGRIDAWTEAGEHGLFNQPETIPVYQDWNSDFDKMRQYDSATDAQGFALYRFYQAASYHRWYVLRCLLPKHGLVVS